MKYTGAIIGLGNIAWEYDLADNTDRIRTHAKAYSSNPKTVLKAGYDPNEKKRRIFKEKFPSVNVYSDLDQMLKEEKPSIVSICSPTQFHYQQVEKCIDSGIGMIWLEKPVCTSLDQHENLLKKANQTTVLVNYIRRYSQDFVQLKDIIQKKTLGSILDIKISYSRGLISNGTHLLDVLGFVLDWKEWPAEMKFQKIFQTNKTVQSMIELPDFKIDVLGVQTQHHLIEFEVLFEEGRAGIYQNGHIFRVEEKKTNPNFPQSFVLQTKLEKVGTCLGSNLNAILSDLIFSFENSIMPQSNLRSSFWSTKLTLKIAKLVGEV